MRSTALLIATSAVIFPTHAFQIPFKIPFFSSSISTHEASLPAAPDVPEVTVPNRIAIIGAGAGGSSAAFWVAKAKERYGLDVEVDVYDKNAYIGGRSTTVSPYDDPTLEPVELGASIFVQANKNLWRAADEFELQRIDFKGDDNDQSDVTGIWDGKEFVLTIGGGGLFSGWLDKIRVLLRYGYRAPAKTQSIVDATIKKFLRLYDGSTPVWSNITSVVSVLDVSDVVAQTTSEYLDLQDVDKRWTREMIEAATRVNYGQNADKIHALEGLVSLAAAGASSVKGGNWQIFENFVAASKASIYLNTTVKSVSRYSAGGPWLVQSTASDKACLYRSVILAAPYHQTGITFSTNTPLALVPQQPYVHLHVTLLSTSSSTPNASHFGLARGAKAPTSVLTTYDGVRQRGPPEPSFNSLTYHGPVLTKEGEKRLNAQGDEEWVVKVFSKERVEDGWLNEMFEGRVGWVLRKEWDAYPLLPPSSDFPPVKLADGLYYVNAFEPLVSTMETETIAARNVVELLMQEVFGAGLCNPQVFENGETAPEKGDDFVYGWDC